MIATDNGMRPVGTHLVPARDLDALVAAAEKILDDPPRRVPIVAESDRNVEEVLSVYQQLLP